MIDLTVNPRQASSINTMRIQSTRIYTPGQYRACSRVKLLQTAVTSLLKYPFDHTEHITRKKDLIPLSTPANLYRLHD